MMADTRANGEIPVPEAERVQAWTGFAVASFLVYLIAAALPPLAALWL